MVNGKHTTSALTSISD